MKPQDNNEHEAQDCPTCHVEELKAKRKAAEDAKQQQHGCPSGSCR